jgi:hypothetical protein
MKKTRSRKSRDTVPLNIVKRSLMTMCPALSHSLNNFFNDSLIFSPCELKTFRNLYFHPRKTAKKHILRYCPFQREDILYDVFPKRSLYLF